MCVYVVPSCAIAPFIRARVTRTYTHRNRLRVPFLNTTLELVLLIYTCTRYLQGQISHAAGVLLNAGGRLTPKKHVVSACACVRCVHERTDTIIYHIRVFWTQIRGPTANARARLLRTRWVCATTIATAKTPRGHVCVSRTQAVFSAPSFQRDARVSG